MCISFWQLFQILFGGHSITTNGSIPLISAAETQSYWWDFISIPIRDYVTPSLVFSLLFHTQPLKVNVWYQQSIVSFPFFHSLVLTVRPWAPFLLSFLLSYRQSAVNLGFKNLLCPASLYSRVNRGLRELTWHKVPLFPTAVSLCKSLYH